MYASCLYFIVFSCSFAPEFIHIIENYITIGWLSQGQQSNTEAHGYRHYKNPPINVNASGAEIFIFQDKQVNTMAADVLTPADMYHHIVNNHDIKHTG